MTATPRVKPKSVDELMSIDLQARKVALAQVQAIVTC